MTRKEIESTIFALELVDKTWSEGGQLTSTTAGVCFKALQSLRAIGSGKRSEDTEIERLKFEVARKDEALNVFLAWIQPDLMEQGHSAWPIVNKVIAALRESGKRGPK